MPAFTFEKISSPVRSATPPVATNSQTASSEQTSSSRPRGVLVQMLDRLGVARIKRDHGDTHTTAPHQRPPPE